MCSSWNLTLLLPLAQHQLVWPTLSGGLTLREATNVPSLHKIAAAHQCIGRAGQVCAYTHRHSQSSRQVAHLAVAALQALNAEVVVVLDGTTEHGDQFMSVRSYLPSEIHWGFTFAPIISCARGTSTRHEVDIGRCVRHCRCPAVMAR